MPDEVEHVAADTCGAPDFDDKKLFVLRGLRSAYFLCVLLRSAQIAFMTVS